MTDFNWNKIAELEKKRLRAAQSAPQAEEETQAPAPQQGGMAGLMSLLQAANTRTQSARPDFTENKEQEAEKRDQAKWMNAIGKGLNVLGDMDGGMRARAQLSGLKYNGDRAPDLSNLGGDMAQEADALRTDREQQLAAMAAQDATQDKFNQDAFKRGFDVNKWMGERSDKDRDFGLRAQNQQFDQTMALADLKFQREKAEVDAMVKKGQLTVAEGNLLQRQIESKRTAAIASQNANTNAYNAETNRMKVFKDVKKEQQAAAPKKIGEWTKTDQNINLRPGEEDKLRKTVSGLKSTKNLIQQYRDLIKKHGGFEMGGASGAKMKSTYGDLLLQLKNQFELGAITGPDMKLMNNVLPDPESEASGARDLFAWADPTGTIKSSSEGALAQLDKLENSLDDKVGQRLKIYGFQKGGDQAMGAEAKPKKAKGGVVDEEPGDPNDWDGKEL